MCRFVFVCGHAQVCICVGVCLGCTGVLVLVWVCVYLCGHVCVLEKTLSSVSGHILGVQRACFV